MADQDDFAAAVASSIKGWLPAAQENAAGRLGLDSAGGVQHSVGGTRVWWVDDKGDLRQGRVPRIENSLGRLSLDSAGGVQHSVSGTRVFWINDQGEIAQGTVPWERITGAPDPVPASGMKTVPLFLTRGVGTAGAGPLSQHYRLPLRFNAPITRYRIHIRNWNPRIGTVTASPVDFTGIWIGPHAGGGAYAAAPVKAQGAFTTPADGSEWVSKWLDAPITPDSLLSFGYTATQGPPVIAGGGWRGTDPADAGVVNPTMSTTISTPFDIWLEAETPASTPVLAVIGDSLSVGMGSTTPVHDAWLAIYCRKIGALPMIIAHSGDSLVGFLTVNTEKVTRWSEFAPADAVIWALGSNDIAAGRTVTQMKFDHNELLPIIEKHIGPVRYHATITPRNSWGSVEEGKRSEWTAWMALRPHIRDILNFHAVVSADGDTLLPEYDADGTHLNTAGYQAEADSITAPLAPTGASIIEARVARLENSSGLRDVSALFSVASGRALLEVRNGSVWLHFVGVTLSGSGNVDLTSSGLTSVAPVSPITSVNLGVFEGTTARRIQLNEFGYARVFAYAGGVLNGTVSWPMSRPNPTTWPGTSA